MLKQTKSGYYKPDDIRFNNSQAPKYRLKSAAMVVDALCIMFPTASVDEIRSISFRIWNMQPMHQLCDKYGNPQN